MKADPSCSRLHDVEWRTHLPTNRDGLLTVPSTCCSSPLPSLGRSRTACPLWGLRPEGCIRSLYRCALSEVQLVPNGTKLLHCFRKQISWAEHSNTWDVLVRILHDSSHIVITHIPSDNDTPSWRSCRGSSFMMPHLGHLLFVMGFLEDRSCKGRCTGASLSRSHHLPLGPQASSTLCTRPTRFCFILL